MDLRDPDLHRVPDLGPGDEHDEVLDPRESIALASDILDLGFVHFALLNGHVRRSEARPRKRHSPLPTPCGDPPSPPPSASRCAVYNRIGTEGSGPRPHSVP